MPPKKPSEEDTPAPEESLTLQRLFQLCDLETLLNTETASSFLLRSSNGENIGREPNEVLRTFGALWEGLNPSGTTSSTARYVTLSFSLRLTSLQSGGKTVHGTVVSATKRKTVRLRIGLPRWFFARPHLGMLGQHKSVVAEAEALETVNIPNATPPPTGYLETRYPEQPQYPYPDVFGNGKPHAYDLSPYEQTTVARRFPATNVGPAYRIWVLPSGHIVIRDEEDHKPRDNVVDAGCLPWFAERANPPASYAQESVTSETQTIATPQSAAIARLQLINTARQNGGFVNPDQVMNGLGRLEWLDPVADASLAAARGLGAINQGTGPNSGPGVVFYPEPQYLNPDTRPAGPGRFEFLTTIGAESARGLAEADFGGQTGFAGFDFSDILQPSAADIWRLRREYRRRHAEDFTADIDLVWVPGGTQDSGFEDFFGLMEEVHSPGSSLITSDDSEGEDRAREDTGDLDVHTGITHEPTNRGENDQTAPPDRVHYQSRMLPEGSAAAKKYTVDRTRAHATLVEKWKGWVCNRKGQWIKWEHLDNLDWADKASVEKLNKWREQYFRREGWPKKREDSREGYTDQERKWLFDLVKRAKGDRMATLQEGVQAICKRFNKEIAARSRPETGIMSVYHRLCLEYRKFDGKMNPNHVKRTDKRAAEKKGKVPQRVSSSKSAAQGKTKGTGKKRKQEEKEGYEPGPVREDEDQDDVEPLPPAKVPKKEGSGEEYEPESDG